jgi:hypothetical protein
MIAERLRLDKCLRMVAIGKPSSWKAPLREIFSLIEACQAARFQFAAVTLEQSGRR